MPDLDFTVVDGEPLPFSAAPTMLFKIGIANAAEGEQIHSIMLRVQIRIEVMRRQYDGDAEDRLLEVFGKPERWGETLRSLLWTHVSTIVPKFDGQVVAELPIACTYDFEVAATKYFNALDDGEIPLLFLFSGTIFYTKENGPIQIAQISWEKEAHFRLPVSAWREMMDRFFPNSAWLRLRKDIFDRLARYKAQRALPNWESTIEELLQRNEAKLEQ